MMDSPVFLSEEVLGNVSEVTIILHHCIAEVGAAAIIVLT